MRHSPGIIVLIVTLLTILWHSQVSFAQETGEMRDSVYRLEAYTLAGPMATFFLRRRVIPENADNITLGYNLMVRLKWHPDRLVAVGLMTGYQQIVTERYMVRDTQADVEVIGQLTAVPIMADISLRKYGAELGASLGFFIFTSRLTDGTTVVARRVELGSIFHGAYYTPVSRRVSVGGELFVSFAGYRGILSIAPQLIFKYELYSY